jgi:GNAT superfamily N-acetyltransferase
MKSSIKTLRSNSKNEDFIGLVELLDADLAARDGQEHEFYHSFNSIQGLSHVVIAYLDKRPIACGAMKAIHEGRMEVKRMYTLPEFRGNGAASSILKELETWAAEEAFSHCVLETGKRQPEAIALYTRSGYIQVPNYPPYVGIENSLCFEKQLDLAG